MVFVDFTRTEEEWLKSSGKGRNTKANPNQAPATTTVASILPPPAVPVTTHGVSTIKDISKEIPAHCVSINLLLLRLILVIIINYLCQLRKDA